MSAAFDDVDLPVPVATARARLGDGSTVTVRRHGNPDGPRVALSNSCGFAADLYWPFWSLLGDHCDVMVYDLRSHGWNEPTDLRLHNLPTLADDNRRVLATIGAVFGSKPTVGVYHSLSAMVALMHEHQAPSFIALVLFDPPIYPPGTDLEAVEAVCWRLSTTARRRQTRFDTPQQLTDTLRGAPAFSLLDDETLDLFAATTLRPSPGGGYELRCPPEHEAQLFERYFGHAMQAPDMLDGITVPIKVIGADPAAPFSFLPAEDLSGLVGLDYGFVPDLTHFLLLEEPEVCAALTMQFIRRQGLYADLFQDLYRDPDPEPPTETARVLEYRPQRR